MSCSFGPMTRALSSDEIAKAEEAERRRQEVIKRYVTLARPNCPFCGSAKHYTIVKQGCDDLRGLLGKHPGRCA